VRFLKAAVPFIEPVFFILFWSAVLYSLIFIK